MTLTEIEALNLFDVRKKPPRKQSTINMFRKNAVVNTVIFLIKH